MTRSLFFAAVTIVAVTPAIAGPRAVSGTVVGTINAGELGAYYVGKGIQYNEAFNLAGKGIEIAFDSVETPADPFYGDPAYFTGGASGFLKGVPAALAGFSGSTLGLLTYGADSIQVTYDAAGFKYSFRGDTQSNNSWLDFTIQADRIDGRLVNWRGTANHFIQYYQLAPDPYDSLFSATFTIDAAKIRLTGIPEPSTWALLIGGFGLVGATLRHHRAPRVGQTRSRSQEL